MPWWRIALYTAAVMLLALWVEPDTVPAQPTFSRDGHAINSLDLAVSSAVCGSGARVSGEYLPGQFLAANQWATAVPLRSVAATMAGSLAQYCASAVEPYLNEDNSLSLLETLLVTVRPQISAAAIARALALGKLTVIALSCVLMLRLGASVTLAGVCTVAAVAVLYALIHEGMAYSIHSFFFVLVLLNAAGFWVAAWVAGRSAWWCATTAAAAGLIAAFSANMRASYLPIYVVFALLYAVATFTKAGVRAAALGLAGIVAGYFLFQYPFIIRRIPDTAYNHSFHTISHPLVLSLALPANDLAAREGIVWDDGVGILLARRVDASAQYLGPGYDKALMTYYRSLWRRHPREMLGIYSDKLKTAGADMLRNRYRFTDAWIRRGLIPVKWIGDGRVLLFVFLISAALGMIAYLRYDVQFGLWSCFVFTAGALLYLESAIILPFYYLAYQNALLIAILLWCFIALQVAVNAAAFAGRRLRARWS